MDDIIYLINKISIHISGIYIFNGSDLEILKIYVRDKKTFTIKINNFNNIKKKILNLIILYKDIILELDKKYNIKTQQLLNSTRDLILKNIIDNQYRLNHTTNDNFNYTTSFERSVEEVINDFKNTLYYNNQNNLQYSLPEVPTNHINIYKYILPKAPDS